MTGRDVPCATGLSLPLSSSEDTGAGQPAPHQAGVELMLRVLREAEHPVTIITVGSLRDVAAAFNRAADLFRKSVSRLFVFIGAVDTKKPEWNVSLDPHAFVPVALEVQADTSVVYGEPAQDTLVLRFEVVDQDRYADVMTSVTVHLIGSLAAD